MEQRLRQSHPRQSLCFWHTQSMEVEDSDQILDLYPSWVCQNGCLKDLFVHAIMPISTKSCVPAHMSWYASKYNCYCCLGVKEKSVFSSHGKPYDTKQ